MSRDPASAETASAATVGPVLLAITAVAMQARAGGLTRHNVDAMREVAEALLPPGHALRFEAFAFATAFEMHARNPVALAALGEALDRGLVSLAAVLLVLL